MLKIDNNTAAAEKRPTVHNTNLSAGQAAEMSLRLHTPFVSAVSFHVFSSAVQGTFATRLSVEELKDLAFRCCESAYLSLVAWEIFQWQ